MLGKVAVIWFSVAVFLSGCFMTSAPVKESVPVVGPSYSSVLLEQSQAAAASMTRPRMDVIIPVFDPGLPEEPDEMEAGKIWPELRRAEANLFAYRLKNALEETGEFGAVRITPDKTATGDLYVLGKIQQSNGEEVKIQIEVYDISERRWLKKDFSHIVKEGFHDNPRNDGKDPYEPVFLEAADAVVDALRDHDDKQLENLKVMTEIRFGASFSDETFSRYLKYDDKTSFLSSGNQGKVSLAGLPSDDDPMFRRIKELRVRDQLFVDRMQDDYEMFSQNMSKSYSVWQEGSYLEIKAVREARKRAVKQAIFGALLVAGSIYGITHNKADRGVIDVMSAASGIGGVFMLSKSIQSREEADFHRDALAEIGQSLNFELEPKVVKFEESIVELTGDVNEQFTQWRSFLKKIYRVESAPDIQL